MDYGRSFEEARSTYQQTGTLGEGTTLSYNRKPEDDPYAPSMVTDLLQGKNEWKNIQEIVKLTFKAICDTVKSQGNAIRELERGMAMKASQADVAMSITSKANV